MASWDFMSLNSVTSHILSIENKEKKETPPKNSLLAAKIDQKFLNLKRNYSDQYLNITFNTLDSEFRHNPTSHNLKKGFKNVIF